MSILYYFIDEEARKLRPEAAHKVVAQKDHNADVIRVGIPETMNSVDLETSAVRCMYQRPKETEVRSKTATYYDTSGGYLWYDWTLQEGDTAKAGKINFSVCLQHIEGGLLTVDWNTTIGEIYVKTSYHSDDSDEEDETITPTVAQRVAVLETMIQRVASGAPIVVANASAMTDTDQIYVLSTDGMWYYYDGSAWVAGGEYGAVSTDATLTQSGIPADAKKVGDGLTDLNSRTDKLTLNSIQMSAGDATNIPENADLNDYILTASGGIITAYGKHNFKVQTTTIARTIANMPAPVAGALKVMELAGGNHVLQLFMSVRERNIYVRYAVNSTFTDWAYIATEDDIESLQEKIDANTGALQGKTDITSLFLHGSPFYSHAFLGDVSTAESANSAVIPSESIHDIEVSRRLGFKVIEANLNVTSDGEYIVIHGGDNNTWGYEVYDINGNDISSTLISANPLSWVKENVRYRSKYSKFRTAPLEFKEWLKACRMNNMIPFFRFREAQNIIDADNIMGKYNYIVYNASRDDTDACISYYTNNYTNANDLIAAFDTWEPPLIISCGNWSSWTDEDITRVVDWAHHEKGFLIGCAGNYLSQARVQKYWRMGFDMISSTSNIEALSHGNLSNDSSDVDFSAFDTTGTVQPDGSLLLQPGQYIQSIDTNIPSVFLGGATIFFRASGSVIVNMYSKYMPTFGVTVAEEIENQVSTLYIEQAPRFRISNSSSGTSNVIIYSIDFRRSKL